MLLSASLDMKCTIMNNEMLLDSIACAFVFFAMLLLGYLMLRYIRNNYTGPTNENKAKVQRRFTQILIIQVCLKYKFSLNEKYYFYAFLGNTSGELFLPDSYNKCYRIYKCNCVRASNEVSLLLLIHSIVSAVGVQSNCCDIDD